MLSCEKGVILIRGDPIGYTVTYSQNLLFLAIFWNIHWFLTEAGRSRLQGGTLLQVTHFREVELLPATAAAESRPVPCLFQTLPDGFSATVRFSVLARRKGWGGH